MAAVAEHVIQNIDVARMRKKLDKALRNARKSANRGISAADSYVNKNPWAAVGIAAGAVAVIGIVVAAALYNPRPVRSALNRKAEDLRRAASDRLNRVLRT